MVTNRLLFQLMKRGIQRAVEILNTRQRYQDSFGFDNILLKFLLVVNMTKLKTGHLASFVGTKTFLIVWTCGTGRHRRTLCPLLPSADVWEQLKNYFFS